MVRTRIAPSPTGYPHIGTIYQAIFDYALAKKYKGQFIVRIEDTDRTRLVEGAEDVVLDSLDWFNLKPDEGPRNPAKEYQPYRQSERKDVGIYNTFMFGGTYKNTEHKGLINTLLPMLDKSQIDLSKQSNFCAYYCFCTKERLEELRNQQQANKQMPRYDKHCLTVTREEANKRKINENYVIRLNVPLQTIIEFDDWLVGKVEVNSNDIDDQVLLKSDGFPTYHFAVVVDDYLMQISHVIRGREWLPSTPKHIILYYYLNWARPIFIHLPVILNMDGKGKLSKRHGHASVNYYKDLGYLPEAIVNYLINIVWNHPEGKEIFTLDEFIKRMHVASIQGIETVYSNQKISSIMNTSDTEDKFTTSQGPRFDLTKLTWINQHYIQQLSDKELETRLLQENQEYQESQELIEKLIPLVKTRLNTLKEFSNLVQHFITEPEIILKDAQQKQIAHDMQKELSEITDWKKENIFAVFKQIMTQYKIKMPVLYFLLTGQERGLPLPESIEILGKQRTIARLSNIIKA
jgi:glutamyl/glutaminyl-tRNA synthetase